MKKILLFLLLTVTSVYAQDVNPDVMIQKVKNNFLKVKDYIVDAHIKVNVDFLKVPETDAKIYFKQPDKVKMTSPQFALVPKEGLNFSPLSFFNIKYSAVLIKKESLWGFNTAVIKVVPLEESQDVILTTLWIDSDYFIIRKAEVTTKSKGTYGLQLNYDVGKTKYFVPVSMTFLFDIKADNFPNKFGNSKEEKAQKKNKFKGTAEIKYSNYIINKGISDNIFKEDKKKKNDK